MSVQFRVCDESEGTLLARVLERKVRLGKTTAEISFRRVLAPIDERCRSYRLSWRVPQRFLGQGLHSVSLEVRDTSGMWSNRVGKVYRTRS
jgi:hypothetical protein